MNFTQLVDTGKYSKDMLLPNDKSFIAGMEEAETLTENFQDWMPEYLDLDEDVVLDKIRLDCMKETMELFKMYLHGEICENIVTWADMIAAKGTETRWRKKPVEVEAFKWEGKLIGDDGVPNVPNWAWDAYQDGTIFFSSIHADGPNDEMFIHTLEGNHHASIGDYVIRGVKGEIYPCKPDIFAQTYEPVATEEETSR